MAAKLLPVHFYLWLGFLLLWPSQSGTSEVCLVDSPAELMVHSSDPCCEVENDAIDSTDFFCILDPANKLNCSWSFDRLSEDAQLSVSISVCDNKTLIESESYPMVPHAGLRQWVLSEYKAIKVVLEFNVTLNDIWTVYSYQYNEDFLEVPFPPQNLTAVINGSNMLVSWDLPRSKTNPRDDCFEYQLDLGDQEKPRQVSMELSYTQQSVDPSQTYRVRIRTRLTLCQENGQWSEWSNTVVVEQPLYRLRFLVILSISLGLPMILLAVLLLVRHQRVMKVLFPPIPRPPPKYIHFLEKNDVLGDFHAVSSVKPAEEEITQVDDTEPKSGKTF